MTKQELIDRIDETLEGYIETASVNKKIISHVLDVAGDVIAAELRGGGEAPLPGLGKLVAKATKARKGRNPKTGKPLDIPAGHRVAFNAGKALKEALRG
ncbi:HU family DNA-binding protein [Fundidesulfovibrio butyratiphilus]